MSRIGKSAIIVPGDVKVEWRNGEVSVRGPKGSMKKRIHPDFSLKLEDDKLRVVFPSGEEGDKKYRSLYGLTRSLVAGMVAGVSVGFSKTLVLQGTGYRVDAKGEGTLEIDVGFSHKVNFPLPPGIKAKVGEKKLRVTIEGCDKELVGQVAANIRRLRPPEPYKGKGIRYEGEFVKLKAGKAGKAAGT